MNKPYLVIYCKLLDDRQHGVKLVGTYFGGVAIDEAAANRLAQVCSDTTPGGIVIPKVLIIEHSLIDSIRKAFGQFNRMIAQMNVNHKILGNSRYYKP